MGPLLRCVGRGLLYLYIALLLVVLVLRYWLLPNVDIWRQPISQILSNITQSDIQIGQIQAQWQGLYPELVLKDVYLGEHQAQPQIHIPSMLARFQLSSLFTAQPYFSFLRIEGLQLVLQRDSQQRLSIAGQRLHSDVSQETSSNHSLSWLTQLQQVELHNATLIWQDHWRGTESIQLVDVQGVLQHRQGQLQYEITASPPVGLGDTVRLLGRLDSAELLEEQLSGTFYVQMTGLSAEAWQQWVELPTDLVQANLESQIWLQLKQGQVSELSLDVQIHQGVWETQEWGRLGIKRSRLFVQGPWQSFEHFVQERPTYERLAKDEFALEFYAGAAQWQDSPYWLEPLSFEEIGLVVHSAESQPEPKIIINRLFLKNPDFEMTLSGSWSPHYADWEQSVFDLTAHAKNIQLSALHKYFPTPAISTEVVDWLDTSIVQGVAPQAVMRWQGNIDQYPYTQPSQGVFYVGGPIVGAELDYYPATAQEKGWPKIEQVEGVLTIRGNQLWVHGTQGELRPNLIEPPVQAKQITVEIDDLAADEPILTISAQTQGAAQAYLGLMTHSDLGALLDNKFTQTKATGTWTVPLHIMVNLEQSDEVSVAGHIDFANNDLDLMPEIPVFKQVQGRLLFTDTEAEAQSIRAQWLGGPLLITQKIGEPKQALRLKGQFSVEALAQVMALDSVALYAQGATDYTASVGFDQEQSFFVTAESSLKGVALHLPTPLEKSAEQQMPLTVSWSAENEQQHQLSLQLSPNLHLYLRESQQATPLFDTGYLTWKRKQPTKRQRGLWVDIEEDYLNLDEWREVVEQFDAEAASDSATRLVDLHTLRIKAEEAHGFNGALNQLTYTVQQEPLQQWRSDISSEQVAGTVLWQESAAGEVIGVIEADFQRIHWQPSLSQSSKKEVEPIDFDLKLEDLDLTVGDFKYGTWHLGRLSVNGRRSKENASLWQIPHLQFQTPYGNLDAHGAWRLDGAQRGLSLSAELHSTRMGSFLDYVGFKEILVDGQGHLKGDLMWHQFPWQKSIDSLQADVEFDVTRGRLNQLQSHTGKLLEFLSLQSISRLVTLGPDLRGLLKNGFPFDAIKAQVQLNNQIISTQHFKVVGPVGVVLLEGEANVAEETLDVEAVVVPSMDMSGVAIAAGFALNPVIGISAFLTQWLFKDPLAKAMTVQYQVTGPWDAIQVQEIKVKKAIGAEKSMPQ